MNSPGPSTTVKLSFTLLVLLLAGLAFSGLADRTGREYTGAAFERALITFAVARGLNGAISVAQGTEVSISPAGMGLHLTPGQVLDPLNDLIERFSMVMLVSTSSLGIQKVLLSIGESPLFSLLVVAALLAVLVALWRPGWYGSLPPDWIYRTAIILIVIRFAVPFAAIGSELVYRGFLSDQYEESTRTMERTSSKISELSHQDAADQQKQKSWIDHIRDAGRQLDFEARVERYRQAAAEASEDAVNLIVVFVMQTLLLPLLFLWLLIRLLRALTSL